MHAQKVLTCTEETSAHIPELVVKLVPFTTGLPLILKRVGGMNLIIPFLCCHIATELLINLLLDDLQSADYH